MLCGPFNWRSNDAVRKKKTKQCQRHVVILLLHCFKRSTKKLETNTMFRVDREPAHRTHEQREYEGSSTSCSRGASRPSEKLDDRPPHERPASGARDRAAPTERIVRVREATQRRAQPPLHHHSPMICRRRRPGGPHTVTPGRNRQ